MVYQILKGDYGIALIVAQHGKWYLINRIMSVYRVHERGVWSGTGGVKRAMENVKFFTLLRNAVEMTIVRKEVAVRRRRELYGLSLCELREGMYALSIWHCLMSVGSKGHRNTSYHSLSLKYLRILFGTLCKSTMYP